MGRLIDADALKEKINTAFLSEIGKLIDNAPTIDAVEVARCKDCKYCHYEQRDDIYHCYKLFHRFYDADKHYCSYGERIDDE